MSNTNLVNYLSGVEKLANDTLSAIYQGDLAVTGMVETGKLNMSTGALSFTSDELAAANLTELNVQGFVAAVTSISAKVLAPIADDKPVCRAAVRRIPRNPFDGNAFLQVTTGAESLAVAKTAAKKILKVNWDASLAQKTAEDLGLYDSVSGTVTLPSGLPPTPSDLDHLSGELLEDFFAAMKILCDAMNDNLGDTSIPVRLAFHPLAA